MLSYKVEHFVDLMFLLAFLFALLVCLHSKLQVIVSLVSSLQISYLEQRFVGEDLQTLGVRQVSWKTTYERLNK